MKTISVNVSHGGKQGIYSHISDICNCEMTFGIFIPPQADKEPCPVLWYLSGLTCTHANVVEKGEYRKAAAKHGVIIICPDTSPRGENTVDAADDWRLGFSAGFYVDATQEPWRNNYQMYSYVTKELPGLIGKKFNADMSRQSIFGHSMGGHGALTIALKNPDLFKSCSAFSPIVNPSSVDWSSAALTQYLGTNKQAWRQYDACNLIDDGKSFPHILVDQGTDDKFLESGLRPWLLKEVCRDRHIDLTLRMQEGYDHSYFFVSTFMTEHIAWHANFLSG